MLKYFSLILLFIIPLFAQQTPLENNNYDKLTTYNELVGFITQLNTSSKVLRLWMIGQSVEKRNIYGMLFSTTKFKKDTSKIRVLIFAQQHGDEQSGKEGALILARDLLKPENKYLFDRIDLALIPQVNPDGSEKNIRKNANDIDLNRNHLILTEPETRAVHNLFDKYLFEATMDVHEYYPYTDSWMNFGYVKNFDEQIGTATNPNVAEEIRNISNNEFLPFMESYLSKRGFSFHNYILGGPPGVELFRHSTYDINDGRQSFGIINSFSFILEGKSGRDSIDNIQRRAESQAAAMHGFLEFIYQNKNKIKSIVQFERKKFAPFNIGDDVALQLDHIDTGEKLYLPLLSLSTKTDTIITASDYHSKTKSLFDVKRPLGYLIPKNLTEVIEWAKRFKQGLRSIKRFPKYKVEKYFITKIDSINIEGRKVVDPVTIVNVQSKEIKVDDYFFILTNNIRSNIIAIALEPKSMFGLVTYKKFADLLRAGEYYPILRVVPE